MSSPYVVAAITHLGDRQADDVQHHEQDALAQQRLVDPVPEGPEPTAQVRDHRGRGDRQALGDHGPDAQADVQVVGAAQVDDRPGQPDHAELGQLRDQVGRSAYGGLPSWAYEKVLSARCTCRPARKPPTGSKQDLHMLPAEPG